MRNTSARLRLQGAAIILLASIVTGCAGHAGAGSTIPLGVESGGGPLSLIRSAHRIQELSKTGIGDAVNRAGAGYPVTADPPVAHPPEAPCVDKLFNPHTPPLNPSGLPVGDFADYADHTFNYTPPSNCAGPYAAIIFKMHFRVTAGVQYDRTGAVWIGATNVFFGTTSEPGQNASPEWNVERDVTEYAPIFAQPSIGQASVYNIVNSQYTGIIYGTAELDFYPAVKKYPAPAVADAVYPLSAGPTGGYVDLDAPSDQLSGTFTFPQNVEAAYLDLILEPQSNDEFWYTCFPNDLAQKLNNCGGTAFREGEVTVDGQPAGVAPIYPWIFTGGIDPYLWIPIPGVETLNFKPYRVNLTPFAASLDDGKPHTIAVSVFNDDNYFATNGVLLVYEDHGSSVVTGALVENGTAIAPAETVVEHVKMNPSGAANGTIKTSATHPVSLKGYVMTSQGRITTQVTQNISFSNDQKIAVSSSQFFQNIAQLTTIASNSVTTAKGHSTKAQSQWTYPLNVKYNYIVSGSTATQRADILQTKNGNGLDQTRHNAASWSLLNTVHSSDTLNFTASGFTPSNGKSRQQYKSLNVDGRCYLKTITSKNYVLTSIMKGCS
ncbi:MAG: peptide-N(4)-(N-acetyl-beta-glucosaminyl)asparagine amidase [Candidatus Eremiobacteraeota bacterium]|nr:peptide-N(4)-(N-acetyl-beta-glucosaminyl)asparagine amidase [Candidatus Eremiobacteraeota bacterium]